MDKVIQEVSNPKCDIISVSDILNSQDFKDSTMELPCAFGVTFDGNIFIRDLTKMGHLLVGGETGQGKSICLQAMLLSLICKRTPDELRLILIDPRHVELSDLSGLEGSYLETPVIIDTDTARKSLSSLCQLMDERYAKFKISNVCNIIEYNALTDEKMPYIVVVIDEYGDLFIESKKIKKSIEYLAERASTVGIHLVLSTFHMSYQFVTGFIRANFPARIMFKTLFRRESRVILDKPDAENLPDCGVMIYYCGNVPIRVRGAFVTKNDINNIVKEMTNRYQPLQHSGENK